MNSLQNQSIKTPYGVKNGKIVCIWDIDVNDRGLKCNCKCPSCGMDLQARLGTGKKQPHFSHNNAICHPNVALQTALHMLAKEIIEKEKKILFPAYSVDFSETNLCKKLSSFEQKKYLIRFHTPDPYIQEKEVFFDSVMLEKKLSSIVPDVVAQKNNQQCLIEIAVTHFVDENKRKKVIELGLPMIEINLSNFDIQKLDKEALKEIILNSTQYKTWINNPKHYDKAKAYTEEFYEAKIRRIKEEEDRKAREVEEKKRRKTETDRRRSVNLEKALQPDNYKKILYNLRNENTFQDVYKTSLIFKKSPVCPFFLDIPISGEFIFKCDRRIWQTLLFENFIYAPPLNKCKYKKIIITYGEIRKRLIDSQLVNWDYYTSDNIFWVIWQYLGILHKLGFIDAGSFYDPKSFMCVLSPKTLIPPNNLYSAQLENALKKVDPYSMDAGLEIKNL